MKLALLIFSIVVAIASAQPPGPGPTVYTPRTRNYYIGAVDVEWNYVPTGQDLVWGKQYGNFDEFTKRTTFKKAVYREFTDATFTTRKIRGPDEQHLGILGPIIRGVVGDTLQIHFSNMASFPFSIAAHGVAANKANDGALFVDFTSGEDKIDDDIPPGQNFTYIWHVPEAVGPFGDDPSSIVYPYHSIVKEENDINSGLFGSTIITRADWADPETAKPLDVDKEFVVLFNVFDERNSLYAQMNNISPNADEGTAVRYALNGLIFGNLRGLNATLNDTVRWYVIGAGSDFHSPDWHGNVLIFDNRRVAAVPLTPGVALTLTQKELVPGTWLFYCHVEDHAKEGMATTYTVTSG